MFLKDQMSLKRENFIIMWAHWKIHFLGKGEGGSQKKQYVGDNCLRRGAWTVCRFKGGGLGKREQCTLCRLLALNRLSFPILHSLN